eukprot:TRINITY_DN3713_c0_g1_i1.p1 TRINITY_DN3713_c0_g1~~TRINITY_DN3713_c0_g1_i1.p1  ORF type:complete len:240 (-),score=52.21 TRINITY_DN3713_c0_g1_i1:295-1014(-)
MGKTAESTLLGAAAVAGAVVAPTAFIGGLHLAGFTSAGIAANSFASVAMSKSAIALGGGVTKGGLVALAQSAGATGTLGLAATTACAVAGAGLAVGGVYVAYNYVPDAVDYAYRHTPDSVKQSTRAALDFGGELGSKACEHAGKALPDSVKQSTRAVLHYGSETYEQAGKYASAVPDSVKRRTQTALNYGSELGSTVYHQAGSVISARTRSAANLGRDVGNKICDNFTGLGGMIPMTKS